MAERKRPEGEELLAGPERDREDDLADRQAEMEAKLKAKVAEDDAERETLQRHAALEERRAKFLADVIRAAQKAEDVEAVQTVLDEGLKGMLRRETGTLTLPVVKDTGSLDDEPLKVFAGDGEAHMAAILMRRRLELYPVEVLSLERAAGWSGLGEPATRAALDLLVEWGVAEVKPGGLHWGLTSGARKWAIENFETLTGAGRSRPEDVDLLVDANERAEQAERSAGEWETKAEEAEQAARMMEGHREEVQTNREEVEADLVEERRVHRQDVDELKGKIDEQGRALQTVRDLIDEETGKAEGDQRLHLLAERIDDVVRAVLPPEEIGIGAGERLASIGDVVRHITVDLGIVPLHFSKPEVAYYRGEPTEDGYRFEKVPGTTGAVLDHFGDQKAVEKRAADAERRAVDAEERAAELQAYVDELRPHMRALVELLGGDEPAWWVRAGDALRELDRLEGSILVHPPRRGDDETTA